MGVFPPCQITPHSCVFNLHPLSYQPQQATADSRSSPLWQSFTKLCLYLLSGINNRPHLRSAFKVPASILLYIAIGVTPSFFAYSATVSNFFPITLQIYKHLYDKS